MPELMELSPENLHQQLGRFKPLIEDFRQRAQDCVFRKDEVFSELCFCLCTPQSKALFCRDAIKRMRLNGLLYKGTAKEILQQLTAVRFNDRKSQYIVAARENFENIYQQILALKDQPEQLRDWLAANLMGFGLKESSHFLRNIGLGENLAILDVHIQRAMQNFGVFQRTGAEILEIDRNEVIEAAPAASSNSFSRKQYLEHERLFKLFAQRMGMSVLELDSVIWLYSSGSRELM